jgi:hypothetical protein
MPPSDQEKVYAIVDAIIEQLKKWTKTRWKAGFLV